MRKGISIPLVAIIILFLAVPAFYFLLNTNLVSDKNVKGANTQEQTSGFYVTIYSKAQTWEMNEFLCKDKAECIHSLESGTKVQALSGGKTDGYSVTIVPSDNWNNFKYLKLFVRSGWGNMSKSFRVKNLGDIPGSTIESVTSSGVVYDLLIVPLEEVKDKFYKSAEFSDF